MAIISAGVIMNIITAVMFFGIAFMAGVEVLPATLGHVTVGEPAWVAGLESGDQITKINGNKINSFMDIVQGVVVSTGTLQVEGVHPDGTTYEKSILPEMVNTRRGIGVGNSSASLTVAKLQDPEASPIIPNSAASRAKPPFQQGDVIYQVDNLPLENYNELIDYIAENRRKTIVFHVNRVNPETDQVSKLEISVEPNPFRTLGLWMDIGTITSLQEDSPAVAAGFKIGDKITRINNKSLGTEINPLYLPYLFADLAGEEVTVSVSRAAEAGEQKEIELKVTPRKKNGWVSAPFKKGEPLSVPALGIAYHFIPSVLKVEADSPAYEAKVEVGDRLRKMIIIPSTENMPAGVKAEPEEIAFGEKVNGVDENNWAYAFWTMQQYYNCKVKLFVSRSGKIEEFEMTPRPSKANPFYLPVRGIRLFPLSKMLVADSLGESFVMGLEYTKSQVYQIYFTLRTLFIGELSVKELRGPIGIVGIGYAVAEKGLSDLMLFLGMLSVNLAVLNFLPIPVLDGGHMGLSHMGSDHQKTTERKSHHCRNLHRNGLHPGTDDSRPLSRYFRSLAANRVINRLRKIPSDFKEKTVFSGRGIDFEYNKHVSDY